MTVNTWRYLSVEKTKHHHGGLRGKANESDPKMFTKAHRGGAIIQFVLIK